MARRDDLHKVLIIGSGPIIIGQACEFDYSGTQACKALREEGISVVLVNSNPATIMTDPEFADRTYVEPITPEAIDKILTREAEMGQPVNALLPTLGGQTGLNCAVQVADQGILARHNVEMIGADRDVIHKAEDRTEFKSAMERIGLDLPESGIAHTWAEAQAVLETVGLPCCIRPAYTLGGTGGGFANTPEEFEAIAKRGLEFSPISEILIEESLLGWKEYELEVMRDRRDNVVIVCSIENFDAMGVHTGDSITVAPAQTLTDKEYQRMRDASIAIMREIGVETGGSNIQFATHAETGRMVVIEMNPRVSRSSALASKATGFPIAKMAAKLAIGYTLDELPNDITKKTPASFEPTIDYCVVKIPRWAFEKFPEADETLTTQMKSVGEAMSIGRTFKESLQKGIRSMEIKRFGLGLDPIDKWLHAERAAETGGADDRGNNESPRIGGSRAAEAPADTVEEAAEVWPIPDATLRGKLSVPSQGRLYYVRYAFKLGWSIEQVFELSKIDPWFLANIQELVAFERELVDAAPRAKQFLTSVSAGGTGRAGAESDDLVDLTQQAKQLGYSDVQLATVWGMELAEFRRARVALGIEPTYKLVDTCAAEFEAYTPYYYSTYETPVVKVPLDGDGVADDGRPTSLGIVDDEIRVTDKPKVIILGGGPNRIGQGIEFDYCCVHAVMAAKEEGYEAVMINSNPETVSTDYDTSDLLFFEPLTHEDVLNICERLNGRSLTCDGPTEGDPSGRSGLLTGVVVQFGGQTPLNLAQGLKDAGVPIIGTPPESIDLAEDRKEFAKILSELGLQQPPNGIAYTLQDAEQVADTIGYPVLVRPSYVLGGRAMEICNTPEDLRRYMQHAIFATDRTSDGGRRHPILVDKFLLQATEVDVDCIADGERCVVAGVMEHIEEAGIHSGDSACALPPYKLSRAIVDQIKDQTAQLAMRLGVRGLMNVQYAVKDGLIYVLEVNPRASRTVPFVSKATGVPWAKLATKVMLGRSLDDLLAELGLDDAPEPAHTSVKAPVFPFSKFPGVDVILGPEMRSTGEVMGIDRRFGAAFAKAQIAAGYRLPTSGTAFISVNDADKPSIVPVARQLVDMGFRLLTTKGTHAALSEAGIASELIGKIQDQADPNMLDLIEDGSVDLLINTATRKGPDTDEGRLRSAAIGHGRVLVTTTTGAQACCRAIDQLRQHGWRAAALQDYYVPVEVAAPLEAVPTAAPERVALPVARGMLFRAAAVAASMLLTVGVLELGLGLSGRVTDVPRYKWDPAIGPIRRPDQSGTHIDHNVRVPYHFNAQGWNDPRDYTPVKPPGVTRVAVVGDSFVEALRVPSESRFVELAQGRTTRDGRPSQWYAFGCSGFGTAQEWLLIRNRVLDYNPDAVVLLFVVNDVYDTSPYLTQIPRYVPAFTLTATGGLQALPNEQFELPAWRRVLTSSAIGRYALFHAGLINWFVSAEHEAEMPREQFGPHRPVVEGAEGSAAERQAKSWQLIEKLLAMINDECRRRGSRFGLVWQGLQPALTARSQGKTFTPIPPDRDPQCLGERRYYMGEKLEPICRKHKIPYLDLTDAMRRRIKQEHRRHDFPGDPHWNSLGHAAAADAIVPWLTQILAAPR